MRSGSRLCLLDSWKDRKLLQQSYLVAVREQNSSENTDLAQILSSCGFKEAAFCLLSGEWGSVLSKVNFILSMGEAAFLKQ